MTCVVLSTFVTVGVDDVMFTIPKFGLSAFVSVEEENVVTIGAWDGARVLPLKFDAVGGDDRSATITELVLSTIVLDGDEEAVVVGGADEKLPVP